MSTTEFTLDTREFDEALKQYAAGSKRDLSDMCNRAAFDVARWSIDGTDRASKAEIAAMPKKSWWVKYIAKRLVTRGVGARATRKGVTRRFILGAGSGKLTKRGNIYTRAQAKRASRVIIAARKKATSFIASGWIPAVQHLASKIFGPIAGAARSKGTQGGAKIRGADKGSSTSATPGWSPAAWIINTALEATRFSSRPDPMPIAEAGLKRALNRKRLDLLKVVADRMQRRADQHNATTRTATQGIIAEGLRRKQLAATAAARMR